MIIENSYNHVNIDFTPNNTGDYILLLDGDSFAYNAAFAGQKSAIDLLDNRGKVISTFKNKTEMKSEFGNDLSGIPEGWRVENRLELNDFNQVLFSLKSQIKSMYNYFNPKEVKIFLQGKMNFRNLVASVNKYKAGRPEKPYYLESIRQYMVNEMGAEIIHFYETDDKLSMLHFAEFKRALSITDQLSELKGLCKTILITKDKDLRMIPGWHYNMNNYDGEAVFITPLGEIWLEEEEGKKKKVRFNGLKGFYYQLLTGDDTDGIPGILGEIGAYKLLLDCQNEISMYDRVRKAYVTKLGGEVIYKPWTEYVDPDESKTKRVYKDGSKKVKVTIDQYIQEIATLLWMVREPFDEIEEIQTWQPPINGWSNIPYVE